MTREEIKNTPEIVDFMLSESVMSESKEKLHKRLDEICNLAIKALEQEPKTGHWIMSDDGLYRPICNNCGAHPWKGYIPTVKEATEVFKYCPNCGCRMVEPQESEVEE